MLFQEILRIRSIKHQVLYRECQVGVARVELGEGVGETPTCLDHFE